MIYFPNAKINLGLHVTDKRTDGFHNLETVFYPIKLSDVLEILPHPLLKFELTGINIEGDPTNNLCIKAYNLLKADYNLPPVYIHLHKIIPTGAGLGGGSADAAFVLKALNSEFKLDLDAAKLSVYAAKLGSDCSFFIENRPSIAYGRGEILKPINVDLEGYHLVLVKPEVHISTAEAYAGIVPKKPLLPLAQAIAMSVDNWKLNLVNDFEENILKKHPEIAAIKQHLYNAGAIYAAMSGSGATVFGLFNSEIDAHALFPGCFVHTEIL